MKRRIALLWGYNGEGYKGIAFNKEIETIEKRLMGILLDLNLITKENSIDATKIKMKSASRTDKGVSAVFNLTYCKINEDISDDLTSRLQKAFNANKFHLYKICQVSKTFIPHRLARSREYKYLIPTGFIQEHSFCTEPEFVNNEGDSKKYKEFKTTDIAFLEGFRSDEKVLSRLGQILKLFEGTHDFHNFTTTGNQGSTKRHVRRIEVKGTKIIDNIEYTEIHLHGDSFILHQIRKMICFAVFNCRYVHDMDKIKTNFDRVFSSDKYVIAKAPAEYLYLYNVHFDDYNMKTQYEPLEVSGEERRSYEKIIQGEILKKETCLKWMIFFTTVRFHSVEYSSFQ